MYTQYVDSAADSAAPQRYGALHDVHLYALSCSQRRLIISQIHICPCQSQCDGNRKIDVPGRRAESFLLASSLVRALSSTVLTGPDVFSLPPGHNPSLKMFIKLRRRVSSRSDLMLSRSFLSNQAVNFPISLSTTEDKDLQTFQSCHPIPAAILLQQPAFSTNYYSYPIQTQPR